MPNSQIYSIVVPVKDIPPRTVRVISIDTNPTTIDFALTYGELVFDLSIDNLGGATASVTIDSNPTAYSLAANISKSHSDVVISKVSVSGITAGFLICHVLPISLLTRLKMLEVR